MPTLVLLLSGPMQSWGTTSRFRERDTGFVPSKSGVIGLCCAALGRDRNESVEDLARLPMAVRVDKPGRLRREYQTASGDVMQANGEIDRGCPVLSERWWLEEARFLVGLESPDRGLLDGLYAALLRPVWPLYLGRKSYPPGEPVASPGPPVEAGLVEALLAVLPPKGVWSVTLHLEDAMEGTRVLDRPLGAFAERRFGPRFVRREVHRVAV